MKLTPEEIMKLAELVLTKISENNLSKIESDQTLTNLLKKINVELNPLKSS
jgi:hypothetical protein